LTPENKRVGFVSAAEERKNKEQKNKITFSLNIIPKNNSFLPPVKIIIHGPPAFPNAFPCTRPVGRQADR